MSSWLHHHAGSHQSQLAATALLSGVAVAGGILGYQALKRQEAVKELKASIPDISERHHAEKLTESGAPATATQLSKEDERSAALARRAQQGDYDDDLILEQLARNRVFLSDDGLAKLRSSFIIVVGCGGVGSHAAASLARSGVSKIRLIDFDQVSLSSLNRHALATLADVGTPKVHCIRRRLEQIAPWVSFDCHNTLFAKTAAPGLLSPWASGQKPDYVLDCIDNITSKVDLLHHCHSHSVPVISSMGAGCKSDPTSVVVGDISLSTDDPLSRSTRRRLKLLGVPSGIPVVFSTEKTTPEKASLLPLPEEEFQKGEVGDLSILPDFRARILPVLGTMPAVFGYTLANHVICAIAGYPLDYSVGGKGREKTYDAILGFLNGVSDRLAKAETGERPVGLKTPVGRDDVGYLVDDIYKGRSVVTGLHSRLCLIPWVRPERGFRPDPGWDKEGQKFIPLALKDLVCMTKEEAVWHEREVLLGGKRLEEAYDAKVLETVQKKIREVEFYDQYR